MLPCSNEINLALKEKKQKVTKKQDGAVGRQ